MTDEMKLITALCEALGFEVERTSKEIRTMPNKDGYFYHVPAHVSYIIGYKLHKKGEISEPQN